MLGLCFRLKSTTSLSYEEFAKINRFLKCPEALLLAYLCGTFINKNPNIDKLPHKKNFVSSKKLIIIYPDNLDDGAQS